MWQRTAWHQHDISKSDAGKQLCIQLCEVRHAINCWCNLGLTLSQGHLCVKLVEFSIAHISCSVSCIDWVETWHKWWGGYYTADHNTLYFNARNFLKRICTVASFCPFHTTLHTYNRPLLILHSALFPQSLCFKKQPILFCKRRVTPFR